MISHSTKLVGQDYATLDGNGLVAHSPNASGGWHLLSDHLNSVGQIAAEFADAFGSSVAAHLVGQVHDLGKADPNWQAYLVAAAAGTRGVSVDHKRAGAFLLNQWGLPDLGFLVAGHHGGIPNGAEFRKIVEDGPTKGQSVAMSFADGLGLLRPAVSEVIPEAFRIVSRHDLDGKRRHELWLRLVFSALIDADRLDTEHHFEASRRPPTAEISMTALARRCTDRLDKAVGPRSLDPVADHRSQMAAEALTKASEPRGWFELTAPTGSGKTIVALRFALDHAVNSGMRRVICAVPFVSVTEQVAGVYRSLLEGAPGEDVVLEHHSGNAGNSEAQTGPGLWARLAIENWDAPVIVTTMVQLLDSLFENRPTRARKLHRIAGSVIVLDEVQSLPWRLLEPTLDVLRDLVRNFGCSVVLSTATQPPLELVGSTTGLNIQQLVDPKWFDPFRRVDVHFDANPATWDDVASRVAVLASDHGDTCLVVVNTIADARALTRRLAGRDGLLHMSTRLCQAHRRVVLADAIDRLATGRSCLLVSTQLIEAGIDIDFPVAVRSVGPLPALAQVAGRVNRHGLRARAKLVVVDPLEGHTPPGEYRIGTGIARDLLKSGMDALDPGVLDIYYDRLVNATKSQLDALGIQRERESFNFKTVAERYRVIADDTTPVLVSYGTFDPFDLLIPAEPKARRAMHRRVQRYSVSLRKAELQRARDAGQVVERAPDVLAWCGGYDPIFGLDTDANTEAMIW
jgi:CRISPR-associated endonuclease/helicase Cas3